MKFKALKRITAVGLAAIMSLSLLAACGSSTEIDNSEEKVEEVAAEETKDPIPVRWIMYGEESPRMKELMKNEIYEN